MSELTVIAVTQEELKDLQNLIKQELESYAPNHVACVDYHNLLQKLTPKEPATILNEDLRQELKEALADYRDGSYSSQEAIWWGCNETGLNEMSDDELIEEYEQNIDEDLDTDLDEDDSEDSDEDGSDELLLKLKVAVETYKMLTEESK